MSVFTVELKNQPGELARLCEAMVPPRQPDPVRDHLREDGTVAFIADDEAGAEQLCPTPISGTRGVRR